MSAESHLPTNRGKADILAVASFPVLPVTDGANLRVAEVLRGITSRWNVRLVAPPPRDSGTDYATLGVAETIPVQLEGRWTYLPHQYTVKPLLDAVQAQVELRRPSAILVWPGTEFVAWKLKDLPPVVVDRIDCTTLLNWRSLKYARVGRETLSVLSQMRVNYRYERQLARDTTAVMVVGEEDARWMRRISGVRNISVVPNGVRLGVEPDPVRHSSQPTVTFTGVMSYPPNVDAAVYFAESIWPRVREAVPDAVFRIVGRSPLPEVLSLAEYERVEVVGEVPDLRDELESAWVAVAPMREGAGIKNKVLEAWAAGTPVVMTSLATNGLYAGDRFADLIRDKPEAFADRVTRFLTDEGYRRYWSDQARDAARVQSWSAVADSVTTLLESVREQD
jgi:glycosyltransferase involved in cell wall biosynthesis